jgi:hypothetical protein
MMMWGEWVLESLGSKPPMSLIAQISDLSSAPATSFGGQSIAGECCRCCVQTGSQIHRYGAGSCRPSATKGRKVLLVPLRPPPRSVRKAGETSRFRMRWHSPSPGKRATHSSCGEGSTEVSGFPAARVERAARFWSNLQLVGFGLDEEVGCLRVRLPGPVWHFARG